MAAGATVAANPGPDDRGSLAALRTGSKFYRGRWLAATETERVGEIRLRAHQTICPARAARKPRPTHGPVNETLF